MKEIIIYELKKYQKYLKTDGVYVTSKFWEKRINNYIETNEKSEYLTNEQLRYFISYSDS